MAAETQKEIGLEIGHVLFLDIVGYSKLLIDEQRDYLHTLRRAWRNSGKAVHLIIGCSISSACGSGGWTARDVGKTRIRL
jgi:hypothetical protein